MKRREPSFSVLIWPVIFGKHTLQHYEVAKSSCRGKLGEVSSWLVTAMIHVLFYSFRSTNVPVICREQYTQLVPPHTCPSEGQERDLLRQGMSLHSTSGGYLAFWLLG